MTKKQESLKNAKESGKKIVKGGKDIIRGTAKVLSGTGKALYYLIDAGDKAIGEQIEKKQLEKGKKTGKVGKFIRDNTTKLMITLSLVGYGGHKTMDMIEDKQKNKQELVISNDNDEESTNQNESMLTFNERPYFQNPDFFDKDFKVKRDLVYKDKGIILMRDAGMTFYVVQKGETEKEKIREKLSQVPEFSYLKDSTYNNKIMGFNVPDASLKKGLCIPIPVKMEDRKITINEFREYTKMAIYEMIDDPNYGEKTQKLLKECGLERVINIMTAFARCETATDHEKFLDPIGTTELHRWEPGSQKTPLNAFSFSYYHILMEKNADGKTPGPGLKARQKLGLTEGQCYHPLNAGKLFLGYCFEKVKSDPTYFFKISSLNEAKIKGGKYNGDSSYGNKLWDNIKYVN